MADAVSADLAALRRLNDGGYGFYRNIALVRADDLFVRAKATDALHRAAGVLDAADHAARAALSPPSREHPFPDPVALGAIRALRALRDRVAGLETRLRGAAALPDGDFSAVIPSDSVRQELVALDAALLTRADAVASGAIEAMADALDALEAAMLAREALAARGQK